MKQMINLKNWKRKEHFELFRQYEEPFWGIVTEVDCTQAFARAKQLDVSFFVYYLYQSLRAVNAVENFRLRIEDDQVVLYDRVHASATLGREDETFAFSFIEYSDRLMTFNHRLSMEIDRVNNSSGIRLEGNNIRKDVIHYSAIPWIHFTGLSHARNFKVNDSTPKISFGKLVEKEGKQMMPVSLHAHHALLDGTHAGKYFDLFQQYLNE